MTPTSGGGGAAGAAGLLDCPQPASSDAKLAPRTTIAPSRAPLPHAKFIFVTLPDLLVDGTAPWQAAMGARSKNAQL
jgi:hypothetical protein